MSRVLYFRAIVCVALWCAVPACATQREHGAPVRPYMTYNSHTLPDGTEFRVASGIAAARVDPEEDGLGFFETRTGAHITFDSKGRVESLLVFRDGVLHGPYHLYQTNGHLEELGRFEDGKPVGTWIRFHENGVAASAGELGEPRVVVNKRHEVRLRYFEKRGKWRNWDDNGAEIDTTDFGSGE